MIDFFGGELLINDSWSGSWAAKMPGRDELSFSGCSDERTSSLHQGDRKPDVIIVYLGTNDWYYGASPEYHGEIQILKDQSFRYAYNNMLKKLKSNYPEAEIWCCTPCVSDIGDGAQAFPFERMGVHMKVYCDVLKEVACENGCRVIDLYSSLTPYETVDGYHPSAKGMETLAQLIIKEVTG